jgi:hypothetical protein
MWLIFRDVYECNKKHNVAIYNRYSDSQDKPHSRQLNNDLEHRICFEKACTCMFGQLVVHVGLPNCVTFVAFWQWIAVASDT